MSVRMPADLPSQPLEICLPLRRRRCLRRRRRRRHRRRRRRRRRCLHLGFVFSVLCHPSPSLVVSLIRSFRPPFFHVCRDEV